MLMAGFGMLVLCQPGPAIAAPLSPTVYSRLQAFEQPIVEIAKKRKRKAKPSGADAESAETLVPGSADTLVAADVAQALIRPLTPAEAYRAGQSVFLEITIGRRKGARVKTAILELSGDGIDVSVADAKGLTQTAKDGKVSLAVPLNGRKRSLAVELRLDRPQSVDTTAQSFVSQLHVRIRGEQQNAQVAETVLSFPLTDCATAYHRALGGIYAERQTVFDGAVKAASVEQDGLPGSWLFPPRKLSKSELQPRLAILPPARRECRWSVETVSFSTRVRERNCKKWQLTEIVATPLGPFTPEVDEAEAQRINARAGRIIQSRLAARDFGPSGKLEWISRRLLIDLKAYLKQKPHPALCSGVDVMTSYFIDNAVTLQKELAASAEALEVARRIAGIRLDALAVALGKAPNEPAETVSISLVTPARAAPPAEMDGAALVGEAGRMLLTAAGRVALSAQGDAMAKLLAFRESLGGDLGLDQPEASRLLVIDALTAVEAAVYLEASAARYAQVGEAIFGSIAAIEKAHGEACTCAP
jgi:hypothetical protein